MQESQPWGTVEKGHDGGMLVKTVLIRPPDSTPLGPTATSRIAQRSIWRWVLRPQSHGLRQTSWTVCSRAASCLQQPSSRTTPMTLEGTLCASRDEDLMSPAERPLDAHARFRHAFQLMVFGLILAGLTVVTVLWGAFLWDLLTDQERFKTWIESYGA